LPYTYSWTGGATTQDLINVTPGTYSLQVSDASGCIGMYGGQIEMTLPQVQQICMVTVDSITNTNLIIWEKVASSGIAYYKIYRESSMPGQYLLADTVNYASMSEFTDPIADPFVRSWRYKISAVDICGNESPLSNMHKTIHLTVNKGIGNSYNLIWDDYEGFPYYTFNIRRHTNALGWVTLDSLPNTLHSYTNNPPSNDGLFYCIEVVSPSSCNSEKAGAHSSTRSNVQRNYAISVPMLSANNINLKISPNPTNGKFTITISNFQSSIINSQLSITNVQGEVIYKSEITNLKSEIDLSGQPSGIYIVSIKSGEKVCHQKLIKE